MKNMLDDVQSILLLGPGPSPVAPSTYHALSRPTLGHLDPYFIKIMDGITANLRTVMGTGNSFTLPISGTGSAGMEAAFVNIVEPGDKVLVLINGVFGNRMADVAGRLGAQVTTLEYEWGTPVLTSDVKAQLEKDSYKLVAVVHAETSTGVLNPVGEIGDLVRPTGALYLVDAVTSLGGIPFEADKWGVDICYGGSQKCLSCPPGISPITFSDRAVEALSNRKSKVPNWYLDMNLITQYWGGSKRVYHHTAPINMLYAFYQALYNLLDEGLENSYARHLKAHNYLVEGLSGLGWNMVVEPEYRLPMLNTVVVPEGVDEALVRARLLGEHNIEIGAGLGAMTGKIIRVGLMGYGATTENVDRFIGAMKSVL